MNEWESIIKEVLSKLGADKQLIPGAKLKQRLIRSASDPASLDTFLASSGLKFAAMLERVEGIVVRKRRGSDMLVGFEGAEWPVQVTVSGSSETIQQLRDDVYTAQRKALTSLRFTATKTGVIALKKQFMQGTASFGLRRTYYNSTVALDSTKN